MNFDVIHHEDGIVEIRSFNFNDALVEFKLMLDTITEQKRMEIRKLLFDSTIKTFQLFNMMYKSVDEIPYYQMDDAITLLKNKMEIQKC